jgi:hypothetical protein
MEESDVRYATGLTAPDPFVLVLAGSRKHLIVSALEAGRARKACPSAVLHTPAELFADAPPGRRSLADQTHALLGRLNAVAVAVGPWFPAGVARALEQNGVDVRLEAAPPSPGAPSRRRAKSPASPNRSARPSPQCAGRWTSSAPRRFRPAAC